MSDGDTGRAADESVEGSRDGDADRRAGDAGSGDDAGPGDDVAHHATNVAVEAVDDLEPSIAPGTPEYVLYGGKGGVGKTTMAAATGLASATTGVRTLVVSTDPAHSLADTLERGIGTEPTRVRDEIPLFAVEIDPEVALDEAGIFGGDGEFDLGGLGDALAGSGSAGVAADASDGGADGIGPAGPAGTSGDAGAGPIGPESLPGADEAAAMQQLLRFLDDDRFDRVIVDTAPTGHTLRLLELPEVLDSFVGQLAQLRRRLSGLLSSFPGVGGEDEAEGPDLDAMAARVERLRATLRDPERTDFRVVMVPEELSVRESRRLLDRLASFGIPVETLVVNRVMEPFEDVADLSGTDVDPEAFVAPDLEGCAFCARRWEVQRGALGNATELFRDLDVRRVPLFTEEVRGDRMLRAVAACLS